MKKYKKDYSAKSYDEWFEQGKWTAFLLTIPLGRVIVKDCKSYRDVLSLRSVAGGISGSKDPCGRKISVTTDTEPNKALTVYIKAEKK